MWTTNSKTYICKEKMNYYQFEFDNKYQ